MKPSDQAPSFQAWVVCLIASTFFFYEFIQMNMFNVISQDLMQAFHINATGLSRMSAFYFVANVIFLFAAGTLLDRFSARVVILIALAICIVGIVLFSSATEEISATIYRFFMGVGSAFCFLSVIRLATRWFHKSHLALVIGLSVTIAMLGGVVSQKPLSLLVQALGWRKALLVDAALGLVIFALIYVFVRDYPPEYREQREKELAHFTEMGYWKRLKAAFLKLQNWFGGIFACLMNLPVIILGGLWGTHYLEAAHRISPQAAPNITQMLFFGTILGSPFMGWFSDRIGLRKLPMLLGAVISLMIILLLLNLNHLQFWSLFFIFFALGMSTSAQILGYPVVAENSIPAITAMSVSVVNISAQGGLALIMPLFGFLMDLHHNMVNHSAPIYVGADFVWAMWLFPVGFIIAILAALALRETYCRRRED